MRDITQALYHCQDLVIFPGAIIYFFYFTGKQAERTNGKSERIACTRERKQATNSEKDSLMCTDELII